MLKVMLNDEKRVCRCICIIMLALASAILLDIGYSTPVLASQHTPNANVDVQPGDPPVAPPQATPQTVTDDAALAARVVSANLEHAIYVPLVGNHLDGLAVNPQNKDDSTNFYHQYYASVGNATQSQTDAQRQQTDAAMTTIDPGWTGNHSTCNAGDISQEFRDATLLRINYFRAMAGIPANVKLVDEYNRKAQQAALMMSVNERLSHSPEPSWDCYTEEGAQTAGRSSLHLGGFGWQAISSYIHDSGARNFFVGHRRWILYPQTQFMGSGDIPAAANYPRANALWVIDDHIWDPRPETREEFVAWPPPGYTPYAVVFPRWSFAYGDADFSNATVTMTAGGNSVSLMIHESWAGYGENTLTWEPEISLGRPASDIQYTVKVGNVRINGSTRDFTYDVTVFDPSA